MYYTKKREKIGLSRANTSEVVENYENMSTVLTTTSLQYSHKRIERLFRKGFRCTRLEGDKLSDMIFIRQVVQNEMNKLKKNKSPRPNEIFLRVSKECEKVHSDPLTDIFKGEGKVGSIR